MTDIVNEALERWRRSPHSKAAVARASGLNSRSLRLWETGQQRPAESSARALVRALDRLDASR